MFLLTVENLVAKTSDEVRHIKFSIERTVLHFTGLRPSTKRLIHTISFQETSSAKVRAPN